MIYDFVEFIENYRALGGVYKALKILATTDFTTLPLGKTEVDGENLFYMVQEYETAPIRKIEGHSRYIDVQAVIAGQEYMGVAPVNAPKTLLEENVEKDISFYDCAVQRLLLTPGQFIVLYPNDLHSPGISVSAPEKCRKVVFKVKCEG